MPASRRDFLKLLGISMVSALTRACAKGAPGTPTPDYALTPSCYEPTALASDTSLALETIRNCWLRLAAPDAADPAVDWVYISGQHRSALNDLVGTGDLGPAVADDVQTAFGQAVAHIGQSQVTCYVALPAVYIPRQDLLAQISLLERMQTEASLDPAEVGKVEGAIAADILRFDELATGGTPTPEGTEEPDETARAAAEFLARLLLGDLTK